jgi:hypothetical protein
MLERICANCKVPVINHIGLSGRHCDWPRRKSESESDGELSDHSDVSMSDEDNPNKVILDRLDKLTLAVEGLVSRELSRVKRANVEELEAENADKGSDDLKGAVGGGFSVDGTKSKLSAGADGDKVKPFFPPRSTTGSLRRDRELSTLLSDYNSSSLDDYLSPDHHGGPATSRQGENRVRRALLIPDFVTNYEGIDDDIEDDFVSKQGRTFSLQSKAKRVTLKEITVPQWITANNRIGEILSLSFSPQDAADYNRYTRQVGDLFQIYAVECVLKLDNAHRKDMFAYGGRWHDVDNHLEHFFLQKMAKRETQVSTSANLSPSVTSPGEGKKSLRKRWSHVCAKFNTKEGCSFKDHCRFPHLCGEKGCYGAHPSHEHVAKGFRSSSGSKDDGS